MSREAARVLRGARDRRRGPRAGAGPVAAQRAVREGRRRSTDLPAPSPLQRRHRPLQLVRPETVSLSGLPSLRLDLRHMLRAAVEAVEPRRLVASARALPALDGRPLFVIAAGKAAWPMASGLADVPGLGIEAGLLAGPRIGAGPLPARFEWIAGGHPPADPAREAGGGRGRGR